MWHSFPKQCWNATRRGHSFGQCNNLVLFVCLKKTFISIEMAMRVGWVMHVMHIILEDYCVWSSDRILSGPMATFQTYMRLNFHGTYVTLKDFSEFFNNLSNIYFWNCSKLKHVHSLLQFRIPHAYWAHFVKRLFLWVISNANKVLKVYEHCCLKF